jgi:hypothetical protein
MRGMTIFALNFDRGTDTTRRGFGGAGFRAQVAANGLGRQFHELCLHEIGVLSREICSW